MKSAGKMSRRLRIIDTDSGKVDYDSEYEKRNKSTHTREPTTQFTKTFV